MTAIVRLFTHAATITAPVSSASGQYSTDSLANLKQPYLAKESITVAGTAMASSADTAPSKTKLLFVQIQSGKVINYEITPANQSLVTADSTSPVLSGEAIFEFGPGWRISVIENSDA